MIDLRHIVFHGAEAPSRPACRVDASGGAKAPRAGEPVDPFVSWLLAQSGLDAAAYRSGALSRRLPACLRFLRTGSPESARALLNSRPDLLPRALDSMLIGVTDFFRDPLVFQQLHARVVPALRTARPVLRCCSVGVSQGHELYSVAMLLAEAGLLGQAELLGIDCRPAAIAQAGEGLFAEAELVNVPPYLRSKYFCREAGGWRADRRLAAHLRWEVGDVFNLEGRACWDLILFRNVAIYLEEMHAASAWGGLSRLLSEGGFLVVGKAERPPASLPLRRLAPCIYRKVDATCPWEN